MTNFAIVHTDLLDSVSAGYALGTQIYETLHTPPDVVLLFAAPHYNHAELLDALKRTCHPRILLGCSSAGEFTNAVLGEGLTCAVALQASDMQFSVSIGRGLQEGIDQAARQVVCSLQGLCDSSYAYRTALVFIDALHGNADVFIERLTRYTQGHYQLYGGGAGDNAQFCYTPVFLDTEVVTDAAVVLEILSQKPIGIGASHSWRPDGDLMRVTESSGLCLKTLNHRPAVEAFQLHALQTFQPFDQEQPLPFFLLNVLGIEIGTRYHLLRAPLAVRPDGSVLCAAEVPMHNSVRIMTAVGTEPDRAAIEAVEIAQRQLYGCRPAFALFFDCVATRLRLGVSFGLEINSMSRALGSTPYAGCNTHGQVARVEGQYSGFLHCTAAVCLFPQ